MKELRKKIFEHIESNENEELKKLLNEHEINLDFRDRSGCSPLYIAVEKLSDEIVELLLNSGADPNYLSQKESPLYNYVFRWSAKKSTNDETVSIAKKLIEAGADIQHKTRSNDLSLLHDAVCRNNYLLVKLLIDAGADVNEHKNRIKATPICFPSTPEIVKALIDAGADLYHLRKKANILLSYLNTHDKKDRANKLEMMGIILENMQTFGDEIISLMGIMIKDLKNEHFELILKRKIELDETQRLSLLQICVNWENPVAAKLLLDHYTVEIEGVTEKGKSPLYHAIYFNYKRMVKLFIDHGASISKLPENLQKELGEIEIRKDIKKLIGFK